jgi:hypothetical protein
MDEKQAIKMLSADLEKLIDRYAREFDMSLQAAIGCLEWEKAKLINQELNPELYSDEDE